MDDENSSRWAYLKCCNVLASHDLHFRHGERLPMHMRWLEIGKVGFAINPKVVNRNLPPNGLKLTGSIFLAFSSKILMKGRVLFSESLIHFHATFLPGFRITTDQLRDKQETYSLNLGERKVVENKRPQKVSNLKKRSLIFNSGL